MALSINNTSALFSSRFLNSSQSNLNTAQERLSSGKRINRASDDAAGLAIAAKMAQQLLGSQQAYRNTNDGIALAQTADGAITELQNITQRIGELSVQAANGTINDSQRALLQDEVSSLQDSANQILSSANYNGINLLDQNGSIDIQVGDQTGETVSIETTNLQAQLTSDGLFSVDISTAGGAQTALGQLGGILDSLTKQRTEFGAAANQLESTSRNLETEAVSVAASKSQIMDADYAAEMASRTNALILQNAGIASVAQGNVSNQLAAQLLK